MGISGKFRTIVHPKSKVRKRSQYEFYIKQGGLGAFVVENSTASFLLQKWQERASFAQLFHLKPKVPKRSKHEF
jgi:hypothetical protein